MTEFARALITPRRIYRQTAGDHPFQLGRHGSIEVSDRRNLSALDLTHGLEIRLAEKQPPTRQELPQDDAHRENVGSLIDGLALRRFGRQVAELALDDPRFAFLELAVGLGEPEV